MNKYFIALLSGGATSLLPLAAMGQTVPGFAIDGEAYYYEYDAPSISTFTGGNGRIGASYTHEFFDTFFTADVQLGAGVESYSANGSGTADGIPDYNAEVRLLATRDILLGKSAYLSPYLGLAYRVLYDNPGSKTTSFGLPMFDRELEYFYWPIGVKLSMPFGTVTFKPSAEYDFLIDGNVTNFTSGIQGIQNNVSNNLSSGSGFRANFDTEVQTEAGPLTFGPFVRYWSVRASDLAPINLQGQTVAFAFSPINHTWEAGFGVKLNFAPPEAPPTQAQAAPMMQPRAAIQTLEAQRAFQVFFDFNKSELTSAARQVIMAAAKTAQAGNFVHLIVTGHTDTVGSAQYNQGLSERRAASVKAELVADGLPDSEITTLGVGKTGLLVPTADGVREAQNRRATIELARAGA